MSSSITLPLYVEGEEHTTLNRKKPLLFQEGVLIEQFSTPLTTIMDTYCWLPGISFTHPSLVFISFYILIGKCGLICRSAFVLEPALCSDLSKTVRRYSKRSKGALFSKSFQWWFLNILSYGFFESGCFRWWMDCCIWHCCLAVILVVCGCCLVFLLQATEHAWGKVGYPYFTWMNMPFLASYMPYWGRIKPRIPSQLERSESLH